MHRNLCTAGKRNGASNFNAGLGGKGRWQGGEAAETRLTYSNTNRIIEEGPAPVTLL